MGKALPRIAQVEFFLTGRHATIDDLLLDFDKRMAEDVEAILQGMPPELAGSRIKAVARFFDERGKISRYVTEVRRLEDSYLSLVGEIIEASGLKKFFLQIHLLVVLEKKRQSDRERLALSQRELEIAVRGRHPVALETWDHRFLPLQDNEAHELLDSVGRAHQVWIFTFDHGNLLSDTQANAVGAM